MQMCASHADIVAQSARINSLLRIDTHVAAEQWLVLLVIIIARISVGVFH